MGLLTNRRFANASEFELIGLGGKTQMNAKKVVKQC